jgi:hypothetical protein
MAAGLLLVAAAVGRLPNRARMESLDILPASAAVFGPLAAAVLEPLPATLYCKNVNYLDPVLRIRGVYPGSEFFPFWIPDTNFFHPGFRIRIKRI